MFQPTVLIADDDAAFGAAVADVLADRGLAPRWVGNGLDAVARLRQEQVHLVVTDFQMPGLNGLDVLAQARRVCPVMPPAILLSADLEQVFQAAGPDSLLADQVLPKPVGLSRLIEVVQALLWRSYRWRQDGPPYAG